MTTREVLLLVKERGLTVELRDDGTPVLSGNTKNPKAKTDKLMKVLKLHRERIIALLKKDKNAGR